MPVTDPSKLSDDQLVAEIAKTQTAMNECPDLAVLMEAHLSNHIDEQARRRGPPFGNATAIGAQTLTVGRARTGLLLSQRGRGRSVLRRTRHY